MADLSIKEKKFLQKKGSDCTFLRNQEPLLNRNDL